MSNENNLHSYYRNRADEYDKIYSKPERQDDLKKAAEMLNDLFAGKSVFEIACGTGYWTDKIALHAESVTGIDINEPVIQIAKQRSMGKTNVKYETADMYNFKTDKKYNASFGGFIWSHIPLLQLDQFLKTVNNFVQPRGSVVLMDNNYVEGSSTPVSFTDDSGNTYQTRTLEDNSVYHIIKNFPTEDFLRSKTSPYSKKVNITFLKYFWILNYEL